MSGLDGAILYDGAASAYHQITFARVTGDGTVYTDAAWALKLFRQPGDATPEVTLTIDDGLTRTTNAADSQVLSITITAAQLTTLLDGSNQVDVGFRWTVTPVGEDERGVPDGQGWEGKFTVKSQALIG